MLLFKKNKIFLNIINKSYPFKKKSFTFYNKNKKKQNIILYSFNNKKFFNNFFYFYYDCPENKRILISNFNKIQEISKKENITFSLCFENSIKKNFDKYLCSSFGIDFTQVKDIKKLYSKNRSENIKKLKNKFFKLNLKIRSTKKESDIIEFFNIYGTQCYSYFKSPFHKFEFVKNLSQSKIASLYILEDGDQILSGIIIIKDLFEKKIYYYLGARVIENENSSISIILNYVMEKYYQKGFKFFHLGVCDPKDVNLINYKKSFGAKEYKVFKMNSYKSNTSFIGEYLPYKFFILIIPYKIAKLIINKFGHYFLK